MGVVTASSSAARSPLGLSERFSSHQSQLKRPLILAFKTDKTSNDLATSHEPIRLPIDTPKEKKRIRRSKKTLRRVNAVSTDEATSCTMDVNYNEDTACTTDVNYNEAAAKLENIFNLSTQADVSDLENIGLAVRRRRQTRKEVGDVNNLDDNETSYNVVRNHKSKFKRLSLSSRIALRRKEEMEIALSQASGDYNVEKKDIKALVRGYSVSTFHISMDWKKMKIAPVLSSSEHTWLFELMQPMKALLQVKELMHKDFGREPTHDELAAAMNVTSRQVKRHIEVGQAARNKLIKHNLRLVLFTINKYFQEYANGSRFNDLCQAGAEGLITAIDRFEPKRRSKLSTYALFWIRHSIMRSMTLSSFTKVPFGLESVRIEIQKMKLKLTSELQRVPTEEEVIEKIGISRQRYNDVFRASQRIFSLHARHPVTQEEFINGVTDIDGGTDKRRQPALLRLAVDDVLDSLKPKENLVIRQRFGLDGKGDRTLGEIAGNLNISREMVRKHELKALMKLKHPTRVDYLRRYIF